MRARCPASTANLGPGFDALALALALYVEVEVQPAETLSISSLGQGAALATDATHLSACVAQHVLGHDRVAIEVNSEIPVGRGLGSSAALAVATAAACGAADPFAVGAHFDGHAENAAASAMGGLVAATIVDGQPLAEPLPFDSSLSFVVLIPERELATKTARALLPETVPFSDAVANLGRMGLLLAGLADGRRLHAAATDDRLHQTPRTKLYPEAPALLQALRDAGAAAACWSGAGPSLLAICTSPPRAVAVRAAGQAAMDKFELPGWAMELAADTKGVVTS